MTLVDIRKPNEMGRGTERFGSAADLTRFAGWSAFVSAAAAVLGLIVFGVLSMVGDPFGAVADVTGVGYVVLALGVFVSSFEHPVTVIGGFVGVAVYTTRVFWLDRPILSSGSAMSDGAA